MRRPFFPIHPFTHSPIHKLRTHLAVWHFLALCFILISFTASAQPAWEFSGYLVNLPVYQDNPSGPLYMTFPEQTFLNLTRLRLRPTLNLGDRTRIALEHEVTALYRTDVLPLYQQAADITNRQRFDWRWYPLQEDYLTVSHFIDRLYVWHEFDFGEITIGRQRVAWGSGRIWNPTDLFNPINPAAFDKLEKDGADLLSGKIFLGNFTDLTLVYNPRREVKDHNGAFRFRSNYRSYDLSLVGGYFDRRVILGGDFAGNLFTAGLRGEGIYAVSRNAGEENFLKFILGLDYQFTSKLYTLAEYQHNGQGRRDPRRYDYAALLNGTVINLAQNYLFLQALYQLHPLVNGGLGYNRNLDDNSGFVSLTLSYSFRQNIELSLGGQLCHGRTASEYGFYPQSLYLKGQLFF
ncbi:MAG: hypothetical protein H6628_17935 [Calditrichae bacterium]|nr:hypothetical protein [Calditrichia bacterium]